MDWIKSYGWPGNVRELRNCLERYAVLWPKVRDWGSFSEADVMPSNGALGCTADTQDQDVEIFREAKSVAVAQFERAYCRRLLEASKHNISEAARRASMSRSHLWRMLVRHGFTESHRHHATDAVTAKCIEDQEFEPDNE